MTKPADNRPNTLWPIGTTVRFLDAWGRNPVEGKVIRHINGEEILIEDEAQVRYCGQTWRVVSQPAGSRATDQDLSPLFEDLLG